MILTWFMFFCKIEEYSVYYCADRKVFLSMFTDYNCCHRSAQGECKGGGWGLGLGGGSFIPFLEYFSQQDLITTQTLGFASSIWHRGS